ncbi:hypothetical protein N0V90_013355 [Kalmusia sp. IMI 367209]|nr:hypothetical protein N0V90_013355 [Kalmusia sp. IMI 367209]
MPMFPHILTTLLAIARFRGITARYNAGGFRHEAVDASNKHHERRLDPIIVNQTVTEQCQAPTRSIYSLIYPSPDASAVEITAQSQVVTSYLPEMTWCVAPPIGFIPVSTAPYLNSTSYEVIAAGTGRCETVYVPTETTVCATTLTGIASKITVSDCDQEITFSSECGFTLETPTPVATNFSLITPAPTVKRMMTYWIAPWQSLTAGDTPSDVDIKICTVEKDDSLECIRYQEVWEVVVVTKTFTTYREVQLTTTVTGPGTLIVETMEAYITDTIETIDLSTTLLLQTETKSESTSRGKKLVTRPNGISGQANSTLYITKHLKYKTANFTLVDSVFAPAANTHNASESSIITNTIVETELHPHLLDHDSVPVDHDKVISSGFSNAKSILAGAAQTPASPLVVRTRSTSSMPGANPQDKAKHGVERDHHEPDEIGNYPEYWTMILWINGYDVTIPILRDNATDFCSSVSSEMQRSTVTETVIETSILVPLNPTSNDIVTITEGPSRDLSQIMDGNSKAWVSYGSYIGGLRAKMNERGADTAADVPNKTVIVEPTETHSKATSISGPSQTEDLSMTAETSITTKEDSTVTSIAILQHKGVSAGVRTIFPWLRAPFVWRRKIDYADHDSSSIEQVQGWNLREPAAVKTQSPYSLYNLNKAANAGDSEGRIFPLAKAPSPESPSKPISTITIENDGTTSADLGTPVPTFGFDPHLRPHPTITAADDDTSPHKTSIYLSTKLSPSSTQPKDSDDTAGFSHAPIFPTTSPGLGSNTPGSSSPSSDNPAKNSSAAVSQISPGNATQDGNAASWASSKVVTPVYASSIFWSVGIGYLLIVAWEGYWQARGEVERKNVASGWGGRVCRGWGRWRERRWMRKMENAEKGG